MPICVTALCGRVSVQAQAGFAPAAIIPKEAVPIDPKQERHISMQSAKSPETAATSARKKNGKKKKNKPRRSIFGTIMRFIGCLLCVCVMAASAGAVLLSLYVVQVTEDPDGKLDLDEQKLKQTSIVYDRDGNEVNTFAGENNRIWRDISAMPENLQNAVIAVEDKDFRSEPGINVKRTKFFAYLMCGVLAGIGGFVYFLHVGSGSPSHASGAEMNAIASSIIGGTMLSGGSGNIIGTLFGVISLSTIKNIVSSLGLDDAWWTNITVAAMICLFLVIQSVVLSRKNKKKA